MPKFWPNPRDRVLGSNSWGSMNSGHTNLVYKRCGKIYKDECIIDSNVCFGCRKIGHRIRDFPMGMWRDRNDR